MAYPRPSSNIPYETLPLGTEHQPDPSYDSQADFGSDVPPGAARPRFLGHVLGEDSFHRQSFSSFNTPAASSRQQSEYDSSVYALNADSARGTPVPGSQRGSFYASGYRDDPFMADSNDDLSGVPMSGIPRQSHYLDGKREMYAAPQRKSRQKLFLWGGLALLVVVILAVAIPLGLSVSKHNSNDATTPSGSSGGSSNNTTGSGSGNHGTTLAAVTGGNGSTVVTSSGNFTYINNFGGFWYFDENDPFNNGARAQSWSPALNETFRYGVDQIRGVNLGGWLNTEPFISPALYEPYVNSTIPAVDEWTLSENMRNDTANGGIGQLENHYKTFITEEDFAQIAAAGLNFVRIPLPYWAIETRADEPFLEGTAWNYFLLAIQWARKYGLRINLDFHALPGSQNGWNHSGRLGSVNVLYGVMGFANAQRSLDYIRILVEFISQPQYKDVVPIFGITNEPQGTLVGQPILSSYYLAAYNIIRNVTGIGEGNGPYISYHDGFLGQPEWAGFLTGADRISLDTHPYIAFDGQSGGPMSSFLGQPCSLWGGGMNQSMTAFGLSQAGEFSNGVNDCGLWVNGVNEGTRYEGTFPGFSVAVGSCTEWVDYKSYSASTKAAILEWALQSMDALQNYFFWTWKIGNSSLSGEIEAPSWSYQLGLQEGWIPPDPRSAIGACNGTAPRTVSMSSWQTGGAGAGTIAPSATDAIPWPPAIITNVGPVSLLPAYTPTGAVPTLPAPTFTLSNGSIANAGDGWFDSGDNAGLMVNASGCAYLDPWGGAGMPIPTPLCTGAVPNDAALYITNAPAASATTY